MQKSTFLKEKMVLGVVLIKLKWRWLQTCPPDLKNTKQSIEILLMVDFYAFSNTYSIFIFFFEIFEIHK